MSWLALDIGGANIKVADANAFALTRAFALWKQPDQLANELRALLAVSPPTSHLAVTMTGELADCFESKRDGITQILAAVTSAGAGRHQRVYLHNGKLVTPLVAAKSPELAAASNWHALASFATRFAGNETGLLIDIGSTTTDIVPFRNGQVAAMGNTDTERLCHHELIYTGVERTPVCAVIDEVPYRDLRCRVANELFATMHDVYVLLGHLPEDRATTSTADGRSASKFHARARLSRMICANDTEFNHRDAARMAEAVAAAQRQQIAEAIDHRIAALPSPPTVAVVSGKGEFLATSALDAIDLNTRVVHLSKELGPKTSVAATAFALATLCEERSAGRANSQK